VAHLLFRKLHRWKALSVLVTVIVFHWFKILWKFWVSNTQDCLTPVIGDRER